VIALLAIKLVAIKLIVIKLKLPKRIVKIAIIARRPTRCVKESVSQQCDRKKREIKFRYTAAPAERH
jgi:hypothetical protein